MKITSLLVGGGERRRGWEQKTKEISTRIGKGIFGQQVSHRVQLDWNRLYPPEEWGAMSLERLFTQDDVKEVVFATSGDKAPGPDCFPALFFQEFWMLLSRRWWIFFRNFIWEKLDIARLNYAFAVLIPKKVGANKVQEYRPISLLNVIYKIITKVLTNRLNPKLAQLVDVA